MCAGGPFNKDTPLSHCPTPVFVCAVSLVLLCRSYILAYNSHALKDIFNVHTLDLQVRL